MYKHKKRDLIALASIPLIMTLANSMLIPVIPLMQKMLGISSFQSSLIITTYAAISIICIPMLCWLLKTKSLFLLLSILTISGVGIGLILPCLDALITEGIEKEQRGTITSLYSSMRFIGVAAGPVVVSLLLDKERIMFSIFTGLGVICSLIALFAIRPDKSNSQK